MKHVDPYPRWYTPVKWLLPISLALLSGLGVFLALVNILPVPAAFGTLAWMPALYASMTGTKAVAFLSLSTGMVSAFVGVLSSFILRSTVLFYVNELRGTQAAKVQEYAAELEDKIAKLENVLALTAEENEKLRRGFYEDDELDEEGVDPLILSQGDSPSARRVSLEEAPSLRDDDDLAGSQEKPANRSQSPNAMH